MNSPIMSSVIAMKKRKKSKETEKSTTLAKGNKTTAIRLNFKSAKKWAGLANKYQGWTSRMSVEISKSSATMAAI